MPKEIPKNMAPISQDGITRREFVTRVGATAALMAGSVIAARSLWQPNHFVPGFEKQKGIQLPSYALALD